MSELKQKKAARDQQITRANVEADKKAKTDAEALNKNIFERAKTYENEYQQLAQTAIDNRRKAKASNQIFVPPEEKLVFVVRVRGIIGVSPKVRKILQLLRLRQINNGVFVRVNAATIKMLRLVEPFIAYGYPSLKTVRELIYKRGYGKQNGQRVPLSFNEVIQAGLGQFGIECVEDLVHEIFTVGAHFKEASNFLWPIKLSSPRGGVRGKKLIHFNEGGQCGQQGVYVNQMIARML